MNLYIVFDPWKGIKFGLGFKELIPYMCLSADPTVSKVGSRWAQTDADNLNALCNEQLDSR